MSCGLSVTKIIFESFTVHLDAHVLIGFRPCINEAVMTNFVSHEAL